MLALETLAWPNVVWRGVLWCGNTGIRARGKMLDDQVVSRNPKDLSTACSSLEKGPPSPPHCPGWTPAPRALCIVRCSVSHGRNSAERGPRRLAGHPLAGSSSWALGPWEDHPTPTRSQATCVYPSAHAKSSAIKTIHKGAAWLASTTEHVLTWDPPPLSSSNKQYGNCSVRPLHEISSVGACTVTSCVDLR